jgi:hypothetical protein
MTYLLASTVLLLFAASVVAAIRTLARGRPVLRVLLGGLAGVAVVWASLLGMAQLRLAHDRHFCGRSCAACIKAREAKRWGPYHLFGTNYSGD